MRASRGKYDYAQIAIKLSGTVSRLVWRYPSNFAEPSSTLDGESALMPTISGSRR